MTTARQLPSSIRTGIAAYVARRRRLTLVRAVGIAAAFMLVWMLMWCVVDRLLPLGGGVRLTVLLLGIFGAAAIVIRPLVAWLSRRVDWVRAAAEIERGNPAWAERLQTVTSRLVGPEDYRGSPRLLEHLVQEIEREIEQDNPAQRLKKSWAAQPWIGVAGLAAVVIGLMFVPWLDLPRLMLRFTAPLASIEPASTTRITVSHEPQQVTQGEPVTITATATNLEDRTLRLHLSTDGRHFSTRMMAPSSDAFTYTLNAVDRDLHYRISGGDAMTSVKTIRVLRRPTVLEYRIRYDYPAYIARQPLTVSSTDGTIEAPVGTQVTLTIHSSEPLREATVLVGNQAITTQPTDDPHARSATLSITRDVTYRVTLVSQRGATGESAGHMRILAIPDRPPIVRLTEPASDLRLTPHDLVTVRYQAFDDYGIAVLRLVAEVNGEDRLQARLALRGEPARQEAVVTVDLAQLQVSFGDLVRLRVEAEDLNGHQAASPPRSILISPRSIDMNTHLRIAELREAQARMQMLRAALESAEKHLQHMEEAVDAGYGLWLFAPDYERALITATEQALLLRQGLLRVIVRSPSAPRSTLLAALADTAQYVASTSDALRLHTLSMDREEVVVTLEELIQQSGDLQDMLAALAAGEQAGALLAEHANLQEMGAPQEDAARQRHATAQQEFTAGVKALGLDPQAEDLTARLEQKVHALVTREQQTEAVDYAGAAQQWAAAPTAALVYETFPMRLEAAAQAEAVRPDADLIRAHDLHLASMASTALTQRAAMEDDPYVGEELNQFPAALAALQAAHRVRERSPRVQSPGELAGVEHAADAARAQMRRWAGLPSPEDFAWIMAENIDPLTAVMEAGAATAMRDYDRALSIDQQMAAIWAGQSTSTVPADEPQAEQWWSDTAGLLQDLRLVHFEPVKRAVQEAKRLDEIAMEQASVSEQTRRRRITEAATLQQRQAWIADAIGDVKRERMAFVMASPQEDTTREQALAALQAARQRLAAMPQDLAKVQGAAEQYRIAADAVEQAARELDGAAVGEWGIAERRIIAAEAALKEARAWLDTTAQSVHPDVSDDLVDQLRPYVPETDATIVALEHKLRVALQHLRQVLKSPTEQSMVRAVAMAREAIADVQAALRGAQDALSAQDPLVTARWFARQAAADLALRPPDFSSAEENQQEVSAALDRAWQNSVYEAARGRMSGSRALRSLYVFDLPIQGEGGAVEESGFNLPATLGRAWGWLRTLEPTRMTASSRDTDPPGYQEALRAYFEALGSAEEKK